MGSLIGRTNEIAKLSEVANWLTEKDEDNNEVTDGGVKFLTLYGPPGIGKTRLVGELYQLIYKKSSEASAGMPYDETLLDKGSTNFLSSALNPTIKDSDKGKDFIWMGARFDDPAYRQYRPFSFVDGLNKLKSGWEKPGRFNKDAAKDLVFTVLENAFKIIVPGAGMVMDGVGVIKDFTTVAKSAKDLLWKSESEILASAVMAMNDALPVVVVLDNVHWAFDGDGNTNDIDSLVYLFKKIQSADATSKDAFTGKSVPTRRRLLVVMTVDSVEYSKAISEIENGQQNHDEADQAKETLASFLNQFKQPHDEPLNIARLSYNESLKLFEDSYKEQAKSLKIKTDEYSVDHEIETALSSAAGLPLRVKELAILKFSGASLDGPMESELIHTRRLSQILTKEPQLAKAVYLSAILAQHSNRIHQKVLNSVSRIFNDYEFDKSLQRLVKFGVLGLVPESAGAIYSFCMAGYPTFILKLKREDKLSDELRIQLAKVLTDMASASLKNWKWGDVWPELSWKTIFDDKSMTFQDELSISMTLSSCFQETINPSVMVQVEKTSPDELAIWTLCASEICSIYYAQGYGGLQAQTWNSHAESIQKLIDTTQGKEYPPPLGDHWNKVAPEDMTKKINILSDWHYGAWVKFLQSGNAATDPRDGGRYRLKFGERYAPEGIAFSRINTHHKIVSSIAFHATSCGMHTRSVELKLEFVRHWLHSFKAAEAESIKHGRSWFLLQEVLSPRGDSNSYGDVSIRWLIEAHKILNELLPEYKKLVGDAMLEAEKICATRSIDIDWEDNKEKLN